MEDATFHHLDLLDRLGFASVPIVGLSLGGWMAAELATRYPERVSKLVLVNPVGLYIEGQPVKVIFGRTPAELAEDMFADQSHPMAQMMHMLSEFRGDAGQQIEVPMELVLPIWKSMSATAKLGWDPYLHNPKLRRRLSRHRRSIRCRRSRCARSHRRTSRTGVGGPGHRRDCNGGRHGICVRPSLHARRWTHA